MRRLVFISLFCVFLFGSNVVLAQVSHRPVEDFTSAQINITAWIAPKSPFVGVVDVGGVANRFFDSQGCSQPGMGTSFSGDITEQVLPDGRTQVKIVLHGRNAFVRAYMLDDLTTVLGPTRGQVCNLGMTPAVGDFLLTLDFVTNQPPGAPLADLTDLFNDPEQDVRSILVNVTAQAPLMFFPNAPAGGTAIMRIVQRGVFPTGKGVPGKDTFPAEIVNVKPIGK